MGNYVECVVSGITLWNCSSSDIDVTGYWDYGIVAATAIANFGWQVSLASLVWFVCVAVYPVQVRGKGVATMVVIYFATYVVDIYVEIAVFSYSMTAMFATYVTISLLALLFVQLCVPNMQEN